MISSVLILTGSAAGAATFTISSIAGAWDSAVLTDASAATGLGTSTISWGDPVPGAGQSGYDFTANSTPIIDDNPFVLGTFTHLNYPVYGPTLKTANLKVDVAGDIDGTAFNATTTYSFLHEETPNVGPCAYAGTTVCPDKVTLTSSTEVDQLIVVGGVTYRLVIDGFDTGLGPLSYFITEEWQDNQALLKGRLEVVAAQVPPPEVPLPGGVWAMAAGLGALGALRRRRRVA